MQNWPLHLLSWALGWRVFSPAPSFNSTIFLPPVLGGPPPGGEEKLQGGCLALQGGRGHLNACRQSLLGPERLWHSFSFLSPILGAPARG